MRMIAPFGLLLVFGRHGREARHDRLDDRPHARAQRALDGDRRPRRGSHRAPAARARWTGRHKHPAGSKASCRRGRASAARRRRRHRRHWRSPPRPAPCAAPAPVGPSSSMSPSTAIRRPRPGDRNAAEILDRGPHRGRVAVIALVDQDERARPAPAAPAARRVRRAACRSPSASAASARSAPSASTAASTASEFSTICLPGLPSR